MRARRAFLSAGHYAPLMATLAEVCAALPHDHIVDAGCGEGYYTAGVRDALREGVLPRHFSASL